MCLEIVLLKLLPHIPEANWFSSNFPVGHMYSQKEFTLLSTALKDANVAWKLTPTFRESKCIDEFLRPLFENDVLIHPCPNSYAGLVDLI